MSQEQHDDHCIMNVNEQPWRIHSIMGSRYMVVTRYGEVRTADLSVLNFDQYCSNAAVWLREESERLARIKADRAAWRADDARWERERGERELERYRREWQAEIRRSIGYAQLLASGYGPIEDLEDEVVLADLEFTDAKPILAVDCQTTHLESLAA